MSDALRPMTLGEILDRTFQIYRRQFWQFAIVSAISSLLVLAVRIANEFWWKLKPFEGRPIFGVLNIGWIFYGVFFYYLTSFLQSLLLPAMIRLTADFAFGSKCSPRDALRETWRRFPANVLLALFEFLLVLFLPEFVLIMLFAGIAASAQAAGIDTSALGPIWAPMMITVIAAAVAAYLWLTGCFGFAWCACRIEGRSAWRSLGRTWKLSRETRWRVAFARAVPLILWWVLMIGSLAALSALIRVMQAEHVRYIVLFRTVRILGRVGEWLILTALNPIFPIALTLFYYDQRIRKEGFDIERMMQDAGLTAEAALSPQEEPTVHEPVAADAVHAEHSEEPA